MIPLPPSARLRAINRWLKDMYPKEYSAPQQAEGREARAKEIDAQMMDEFWAREEALMNRMMDDRTWGTVEGTERYPMERMQIWNAVFAEFLPTPPEASTSDHSLED